MESNLAIEPGKPKIITAYGDIYDITDKELDKHKIKISGCVAQTPRASHSSSQSSTTKATKNGQKASKAAEHAVVFRFQKAKAEDTGFTVDQLGVRDVEGTHALQMNTVFESGVHTWELIFPICITSIEFGVKTVSSGKKFFKKFKTSTPRFATLTLDVDRQKLSYRLNNDSSTDKTINMDAAGPYVPFVATTKADVEAIVNPYPRLPSHQVTLGRKFDERQYRLAQLKNTLALSHLPRGFAVNSDAAFVNLYFNKNEAEIESIHMPRDNSPFRTLRGWAVIRLSSEAAYNSWVNSQVAAEGRQIVIHSTAQLVEYAAEPDNKSRLRGEALEIAEFIHDKCSSEEALTRDEAVFGALEDFYLKFKSLQAGQYDPATAREDVNMLYLQHVDKLLAIDRNGRAKVVHRNQKGCFSLDQLNFSLYLSHDQPRSFILSADELSTLLAYIDWNVLADQHSGLKKACIEFFSSASSSLSRSGENGESFVFSAPVL